MNQMVVCMLCGSRAWCSASKRTSGSFSSTPGLSEIFTAQSSRPSRLWPMLNLEVSVG